MSIYYDELTALRNHYEDEVKLLKEIFEKYNIDINCKILDASCGTAGVGKRLYELGYQNLFLTDGSPQMISKARKSFKLGKNIHQVDWKELKDFFSFKERFDFVYILGNSIAHAKKDELGTIFDNIRNILNPNGIFIFDIRNWITDEKGNRIQEGRREGHYRALGSIKKHKNILNVIDKVHYTKSKQSVYYYIFDKNFEKVDSIKLTYATFTIDEIKHKIIEKGFEVENISKESWPYKIVCCIPQPNLKR